MYLLTLLQEEEIKVGLFENLEEGKKFVKQIPGYKLEREANFEYETIDIKELPDYLEVGVNGNIVPISKFMFIEDSPIDIIWQELPNLSKKGDGIIEGFTRVDAYSIENVDVSEYISKRENNYNQAKKILESKGYEVNRNFFGSEDGEAIVYKKKDEETWHFLDHMDPSFVQIDDLEEWIKDII